MVPDSQKQDAQRCLNSGRGNNNADRIYQAGRCGEAEDKLWCT